MILSGFYVGSVIWHNPIFFFLMWVSYFSCNLKQLWKWTLSCFMMGSVRMCLWKKMRFRISYFYQRSIFYEYLAVTCYLEIDDLGSQVCVERSVLLHDIQKFRYCDHRIWKEFTKVIFYPTVRYTGDRVVIICVCSLPHCLHSIKLSPVVTPFSCVWYGNGGVMHPSRCLGTPSNSVCVVWDFGIPYLVMTGVRPVNHI